MHADSLKSIVTNYTALDELRDSASTLVRDTEMIARIRGVAAQMKVFDFFYGLVLGELLLQHSDNLSRTLQHSSISAAEGQTARLTVGLITTQKVLVPPEYEMEIMVRALDGGRG